MFIRDSRSPGSSGARRLWIPSFVLSNRVRSKNSKKPHRIKKSVVVNRSIDRCFCTRRVRRLKIGERKGRHRRCFFFHLHFFPTRLKCFFSSASNCQTDHPTFCVGKCHVYGHVWCFCLSEKNFSSWSILHVAATFFSDSLVSSSWTCREISTSLRRFSFHQHTSRQSRFAIERFLPPASAEKSDLRF